MSAFQFHSATILKNGAGLSGRAGSIIKPYVKGKLLVVTDDFLSKSGLLTEILASFTSEGIPYEVFAGVDPNPSTEVLDRALAFLRQTDCQSVIGIGGGSSIDAAKGVAAMATNSGSILDYEGYDKIPNEALPLFAIPTTSGTGSECTASTVFTNKETLFKTVIISPLLFPKVAILDAVLTLRLPPNITAATGMDALTHAIESYVSKQANPITQALALHAIRMISANIRPAYFPGTSLAAREEMLVASYLAGLAFSQSKLGNVHAISHTFGGVFDIPHGIANATLLPYVIDFNIPACPELFRDIAIALGIDVKDMSVLEAAQSVVEFIEDLNLTIGIPENIRDLGVSLDFMPQMVKDSMRSGNVLVNPRSTTAADIEAIIQRAYLGKY